MTSRARRIRNRLLALGLGLLLVPIVLELLLQAASLFVSSDRTATEGRALVVCQGDSHTYGLWLPPEHAYPAQLQALLEDAGAPLSAVVNRGIPGKTTWQVRDELAADLERWSPRAVCLWGGVNDRTGQHPGDGAPGVLSRLRTLKLARNLADRLSPRHEEADGGSQPVLPDAPVGDEQTSFDVSGKALTDLGDGNRRLDFEGRTGEMTHLVLTAGNPSVDEYTRWIEDDLVEAARRARAAGAVPLLLSYPVDDAPRLEINGAIERAARRAGARFVDLRPHFEAAAELHGWEILLYGRGHPKPLGYSVIARCVLRALIEEGICDATARDELEAVRAWEPEPLVVRPWLEEGRVVGLEVDYVAGHRVQAVFARRAAEPGPQVTYAGAVRLAADVAPADRKEDAERFLPLADDELLRKSLVRLKRYLVTLDTDGRARIRLHPELEGEASLFGAACTVTPHEGVSRVSEAVRLR